MAEEGEAAEALNNRVKGLEEGLEQMRLRNIQVTVQAPPVTPKLKTFTGLPPTSAQEITYREWRQQAREVEGDELGQDKSVVLRRSLKGAAYECVKGKQFDSVGALVKELGSLFGDFKSPEDLYLEISQTRPTKGQTLSDFLMALSIQMRDLKEQGNLSDEDYHRRLFSEEKQKIPLAGRRKLKTAAELFEGGLLHLHPVRLYRSRVLTIAPGETAQLAGELNNPEGVQLSILPRSRDWLPGDVEVVSATITPDSSKKTSKHSPKPNP
ncbi:hypothetical protein ACOMHN_040028 [Nucella lapillus]